MENRDWVKRYVAHDNKQFQNQHQQDAQEFLAELLNCLNNELN